MATIPTRIHPLLSISFNADTDFTTLADRCDHFTEALIETNVPGAAAGIVRTADRQLHATAPHAGKRALSPLAQR